MLFSLRPLCHYSMCHYSMCHFCMRHFWLCLFWMCLCVGRPAKWWWPGLIVPVCTFKCLTSASRLSTVNECVLTLLPRVVASHFHLVPFTAVISAFSHSIQTSVLHILLNTLKELTKDYRQPPYGTNFTEIRKIPNSELVKHINILICIGISWHRL